VQNLWGKIKMIGAAGAVTSVMFVGQPYLPSNLESVVLFSTILVTGTISALLIIKILDLRSKGYRWSWENKK